MTVKAWQEPEFPVRIPAPESYAGHPEVWYHNHRGDPEANMNISIVPKPIIPRPGYGVTENPDGSTTYYSPDGRSLMRFGPDGEPLSRCEINEKEDWPKGIKRTAPPLLIQAILERFARGEIVMATPATT